VRLKDAQEQDHDKVFALKKLRKTDGMGALETGVDALLMAVFQSSASSRSNTSGTSAMSLPKSPATLS